MTFGVRPPAKLNLTLAVGPPADDGYHPLRSVFVRIGLSDRLTMRTTTGDRDHLSVNGPFDAPAEGNIVLRALTLLRRRLELDLPPLEVELEKHIPLAAGLGGGSSDALAALDLAAACWGVGLSPTVRLELAAELGSDVPFFAANAQVALIEGRGERVQALPAIIGRPGVLAVTPPVQVSTPAAFARFDDIGSPSAGGDLTDALANAIRGGMNAGDLVGWAQRLRDANDLWPAAASLAPELNGLRRELEQRTHRPWLLTGSGSSVFAFYPSPEEAADAGGGMASASAEGLDRARLYATDLDGPDPIWRRP